MLRGSEYSFSAGTKYQRGNAPPLLGISLHTFSAKPENIQEHFGV